MKKRYSEKGQALILITFAIMALVGLAGLAIDGSEVLSDRRHAQNAADTAAFAAALTKTKGGDFNSAALFRAASNGYDNNGTSNIVDVYDPPIDGIYAGNNQYIQIKITSNVKTSFASVIGTSMITNKVEAVAQAVPGTIAPMYGGSAVVGLNQTDCNAVFYNGNANMTLTGSGIYVNSSCQPNAFGNQSGSPGILTAPCLQTVGGYSYTEGKVIVDAGCPRSNVPAMKAPPAPTISCSQDAAKVGSDTLSPGNWTGAFPPNGVTYLQPGIYCVDGNFSINGGDTLIGDDVVIYLKTGTLKWNGGATIRLNAPDSGDLKGLLIYQPPTNTNSVTINGNGDSAIVGSIWAPGAQVVVEGGGGASGLECQIIGDTVKLSGSSATTIDFKADLNYQPPIPPSIELSQ
ncbi:MAG: pilus assembly protein TadG-related protein [Anaerolineales bacterium]